MTTLSRIEGSLKNKSFPTLCALVLAQLSIAPLAQQAARPNLARTTAAFFNDTAGKVQAPGLEAVVNQLLGAAAPAGQGSDPTRAAPKAKSTLHTYDA